MCSTRRAGAGPSTAGLLAPRLTGRIEVDGVGFRYDRRAPLVLRDISLVVEPGQKVALVGRPAAGKSTLARLLLGLYPPTGGRSSATTACRSDADLPTLRRQFGVVLQEPFLFSGSIRREHRLQRPRLTLERDRRGGPAGAPSTTRSRGMPMGYETLLAEGGAGLSGGQRQRLALARALAHRPAILRARRGDQPPGRRHRAPDRRTTSPAGCTRIVIAHRLSTIRDADLILVLDDGAVVERGTHEELLARGGLYAALVRHQTRSRGDASDAVRRRGRLGPSGSLVDCSSNAIATIGITHTGGYP